MSIRATVKAIDREAQHRRELERNTAYLHALAWVQARDPDPLHDTDWYIGGCYCATLDEQVRALLATEAGELRRAA